MLNEWERRFLELTQNHLDLVAAVHATGSILVPEYFGYVARLGTTAEPLANGVTRSATIAIQADAWFVIQYLQVSVVWPDTATFGGTEQFTDPGNVLLQVTDVGSGDELFSQPAGFPGFPASLLAGTPTTASAGIPYVFPTPRLVPPQTNIKIEMTQMGFNAAVNPEPVGCWIMLNGARVPLGGLL